LLVSHASGGSVSEGANHKAFRRMDLRLFKYSSLPGLGSGLIDHIQKMTMAAMAIADMKVWAQRSYRV
jgi:hypothetical protein